MNKDEILEKLEEVQLIDNIHIGSNFDDFLAEEDILEECTDIAITLNLNA